MTKNSTTPNEAEPNYDDLPSVEDDIVQEVAELAPAPVQEDKGPEPEAAQESPRDEITRLFREARDAEQKAEQEEDLPDRDTKGRFVSEADDESEKDADEVALELQPELSTESDSEEEEEFIEDHGKQYSKPEPKTIKLLVDGEEVEMDLADVRKHAQISMASDNRLQQAKDLLAAAKQQALTPPTSEEEAPNDQNTEPVVAQQEIIEPTSIDKEALAKIVEAIQIGDAEEGTKAVTDLVTMITSQQHQPAVVDQTPHLTREEIAQMVRETQFSDRQQDKAQTAFQKWSVTNKDIIADNDAVEMMRAITIRNMKEDLLSVGVTEAELAPIANNVDQLSAAHGYHNVNGQLRSYDELLDQSSQHVRNVYRPLGAKPVDPKKQTSTQEKRIAEKKSLQQPKHGTQRTAAPKAKKPPTSQEIVQQMIEDRGYK